VTLDGFFGTLHAELLKIGTVQEKLDDRWKETLAKDCKSYRTLRDAAYALKHGALTHSTPRLVTRSEQIQTLLGAFDAAAFQQNAFKQTGFGSRARTPTTEPTRSSEMWLRSPANGWGGFSNPFKGSPWRRYQIVRHRTQLENEVHSILHAPKCMALIASLRSPGRRIISSTFLPAALSKYSLRAIGRHSVFRPAFVRCGLSLPTGVDEVQ
jgi:hypothetical protein